MEKRTICGDPHAVHGNLEQINTLFDIFEDLGLPVIILGDLFDTKEIVRAKCFNLVHKRLSESKLHFTILVGNHDWFNLDCQEHSLETLKLLENVTIIDRPTVQRWSDKYKVLLLPYFDDKEKLAEALNTYGGQALFMHQGIIGFDYGNGHVADGNGHGEVAKSNFDDWKRVISGHFHKFAQAGNITFLGTPFSHSFGETDQVKYLGIFDPNTDELELLETPFARHRTIELDVSNPGAKLELKKLVNDKDLFRVKLVGTEMQIKSFDQEAWDGVKFLEEPTDGDQVQNVSLNDTDSNEQKFLSWAKEIKGLDEETIKLGLDILGEAK